MASTQEIVATGRRKTSVARVRMTAGSGKIQPISGLGDQAAIASEGGEKGLSRVLMLYIAKGNAFVTIGIGGINDEKVALEKARTLARNARNSPTSCASTPSFRS